MLRKLTLISLLAVICPLMGGTAALGQALPDIYATANGHTFKLGDLSPPTQAAVAQFPEYFARERSAMLDEMVNEAVLNAEAKLRGTTVQKVIELATSKVPAPGEDEIRSVYTANVAALGGRPLEEVRKTIVEYLKHEADKKAVKAFVDSIKAKHKFVLGRDVNDESVKQLDPIFTIGNQAYTLRDFENKFRLRLYELRADLGDTITNDLQDLIFSTLVNDEARAQDIDSGTYISREVTSKLTNYSDGELESLQDALRERLFSKYQVKIMYREPEPVAQDISVDDDPFTGPVNAPVTVVMFSDFQCPACSATHPALKRAIERFPGKVKLVVRDFPLTNIHKNAFNAALAANAAKQSGKFFEYIEILYKNQESLDPVSLKKYAVEIGVPPSQFDAVFKNPATVAEVKKDMRDGEDYGINSTPTIFVNGVRVRHLSESGIRRMIERALAE